MRLAASARHVFWTMALIGLYYQVRVSWTIQRVGPHPIGLVEYWWGAWMCLAGAIGAGWMAYRRLRLLTETPMAQVGTAAQGLVRLHGSVEAMKGVPTIGPALNVPVAWFRATRKRWDRRSAEYVCSDASFVLSGARGSCIVEGDSVDVLNPAVVKRWTPKGRWRQSYLPLGDNVVVIGRYRTIRPTTMSVDPELNERLDALKHSETERDSFCRVHGLEPVRLDGSDEDTARWLALVRVVKQQVQREAATEFGGFPESADVIERYNAATPIMIFRDAGRLSPVLQASLELLCAAVVLAGFAVAFAL